MLHFTIMYVYRRHIGKTYERRSRDDDVVVPHPLARCPYISTAPDLSGLGRVDMLTHPVAAARAAVVATGALG